MYVLPPHILLSIMAHQNIDIWPQIFGGNIFSWHSIKGFPITFQLLGNALYLGTTFLPFFYGLWGFFPIYFLLTPTKFACFVGLCLSYLWIQISTFVCNPCHTIKHYICNVSIYVHYNESLYFFSLLHTHIHTHTYGIFVQELTLEYNMHYTHVIKTNIF